MIWLWLWIKPTAAADVEGVIRAKAGEWLRDIRLFDVYSGKGVEDGKKSLALGVTWRHPERTLNDEEVNETVCWYYYGSGS